MVQHMVVKGSLFLCCGVMGRHAGSDDVDRLGGLLRRDRFLGMAFFVAAMSLVGLPPLSPTREELGGYDIDVGYDFHDGYEFEDGF